MMISDRGKRRFPAALILMALLWLFPAAPGRAEPAPPPTPPAPAKGPAGALTGRPRARSTSRFEAGANGTQGNSETFDSLAAFKSDGRTEAMRIKLDARYCYGSKGDQITRNEYTIGVFNEWFLPESRWSLFIQARYDWDAFESWFGRVSTALGVGYKFIDLPRLTAVGRVGAGHIREYGSELTQSRPECLASTELDWTISDQQKFSADATYYPDLDRPRIYRVVSSTAYTAKISAAGRLSLKVGAHNEYQSEVDPGFEHNDLKYYASLVIDF
ncbi:MAG TPA: DUF481 domain-containing protein [bacterium]|nr:DUF481 domain-containing protein [bacterium]